MVKICSSPTIQGLENLARKYFMSPSVHIKEGKFYNSKGEISGFHVALKSSKYLMYQS